MIRLLLFLLISVVAAGGTSMAENVSTCSVDMVPIQILDTLWEGKVTTLSAVGSPSGIPSFNAFVSNVTEHIAAKLAQEKLCLNSAESKERSLVQFAFIHVAASENDNHITPLLQPLEVQTSSVCRISSPWIDIAIERGPVPSVRAVVRFNERQLLADQALIAGASDVPSGVAMPLKAGDLTRYVSMYQHSKEYFLIGGKPLEKPIEELVPPDVLWLLSRTRFVDLPGSETIAMRDAMDWGAEGYTKIVITLIDQCFVSNSANIKHGSIQDMADLVPLELYKIVMPIIETPVR